ncbi:hypothetical protein Droror1_Dr00009893 [Drosera rotundifolia]
MHENETYLISAQIQERAAGMYSTLPYGIAQVIAEIPYIFIQTTYFSLIIYAMVAAISASAFFALFALFSGFFIPRHRIPKWWMWYYWICPVAWTVYGLIVSQYGDLTDTIQVPGIVPDPSIKWYVMNYFGYDPNFMGPVAVVLVAFAVFFAFMFALCSSKLNFQHR